MAGCQRKQNKFQKFSIRAKIRSAYVEPLNNANVKLANGNQEKAEVLNKFFSSVCTKEVADRV